MMPESRSARPVTAMAETIASRTVVDTEIVVEEVSADGAAADEEVVVDVEEVASEVVEATARTEMITTDTVEVETDTGTMIRMEERTETVVVFEVEVVEEGAGEEVVVEAVTLEVVITAKTVGLDAGEVEADSDLVKMTITTRTEKSRWTSPGSCTFLLRRPKTRTKSSAPASAPVLTLTNSTTSRST